jgi:lipopolysaccharide transport system ATP-binding protein
MSQPVIKVEHLSKAYQIGQIGTGTLSRDIERFWTTRVRGKEDPFLKIGETNDRSVKGTSDIVWSLRDINFEVNQGDAVGIIGKNGAGKSTLLKILSRVTGPTTGQIKVKGRIASLLEVGTGFHPELTGRENIFLNGAILGMRKREIARKLDEIIDFSGVERYIDTPVKRYSSGMYVRLAFAVAAHLESEILIVDEVLAVGDAEFQKKCLGKMGDISKGEGRTLLFVSHNMAAVRNLCNRGIVLENGMVVIDDQSDAAISGYLNRAASNEQIDLAARTDKKGNRKLSVHKIDLVNHTGVSVVDFTSGEPCKIRFHYHHSGETVNLDQLTVVVQFKNESEDLVTTIATDELGTKFTSLPQNGYIEIDIPRLQFREGHYAMSYMISEKPSFMAPHQIIEYLADARRISVARGDYWNSGILNRPKGFIQESSISIQSGL